MQQLGWACSGIGMKLAWQRVALQDIAQSIAGHRAEYLGASRCIARDIVGAIADHREAS